MKQYIYRRPDGMEIKRTKKEEIPGYELIDVVDFKKGESKGYRRRFLSLAKKLRAEAYKQLEGEK